MFVSFVCAGSQKKVCRPSKEDSNVQCFPKVTEARRNILAYAPSEQISGTAGA